jgi:hypothetical protein
VTNNEQYIKIVQLTVKMVSGEWSMVNEEEIPLMMCLKQRVENQVERL